MKTRFVLSLAAWGSLGWVMPVLAHGAHIDYQSTESVQIQARYDSGEPMQGAQVMVYAPNDLSTPWTQGTTDDQGHFLFAPDAAQPGNWEVTVRQAGHGDIVAIPIQPEAAPGAPAAGPGVEPVAMTTSQTAPLSPVQQGITIGAVIWGFVGTALFFARGKR
jgi:nickel transport protein